MKNLFVLSTAIVLALLQASLAFDIPVIQIFPSQIKLASSKNHGNKNTTVESKDIAYSVRVTSTAFQELTDVTVKYNIFYQVAELGSKSDPDIKLSAGSHTIPRLLTNKPIEFETDPINLTKASLDPGWYFVNRASANAQDKVVAIWFKAFDSTGKKIGEYPNPDSISTSIKLKWKD